MSVDHKLSFRRTQFTRNQIKEQCQSRAVEISPMDTPVFLQGYLGWAMGNKKEHEEDRVSNSG